jgi:hypothetical protein
MKKTHVRHHHKGDAPFEEEEEKSILVRQEERALTAEGFRRRTLPGCQETRSRGIYRGRRQGKKG